MGGTFLQTERVKRSCLQLLPRALLVFCGSILSTFLPLRADEPPTWVPGPVQQADPALQDLELTLRAREAIARDPKLAACDILVSVHQRVATLRGSVPSTAMVDRAYACLRNVRGLVDIENVLRTSAPDGYTPNPLTLGPIQQRVPIAEPTSAEPPRKQSMLVRRLVDEGWTPGPPIRWQPARQEKTDAPSVSDAQLLTDSIESVRLSDDRFRRLRVRIRENIATIEGEAVEWEHAADLARRVARVSGIQRVIIGDVRTERQP
jgi:hypothetical protein